jgi:hypothetical protein
MSNQQNDALLEQLFEEGLDLGLSEDQAAKYARDKFNSMPEPDYKEMKKGGVAFPDLTGDGKVTRADILKGRGVKGFKGGGAVMKGRGGSYKGCK